MEIIKFNGYKDSGTYLHFDIKDGKSYTHQVIRFGVE